MTAARITRKKIINQINSTKSVSKTPAVGETLRPRMNYELRTAGDYFLPDVRTGLVVNDAIRVIALGSAVPIIRVQGGNSEQIIMGFKAPFQEDTNLELDVNLEVVLNWEPSTNRWRVK